MAAIPMPANIIPSGSNEPKALLVIAPTTALMRGGPPPIYTRAALVMPATDQLLNSSGGYAI